MSIIGISGKKTVGKSTIAKIIQYLTSGGNSTYIGKDDNEAFKKFVEYYEDAKLEDGKYLYDWKIVTFVDPVKDLICNLIGCSRDNLENEEFKNKELGKEWWDYNFDYKLLPYESVNDLPDIIKLTPRQLLQKIDTDMGKVVHPDIWVNAVMKDYRIFITENVEAYCEDGYYNKKIRYVDYPNWIMSDIRFPNELKAVEDRGGFVIRVNRDGIYKNEHLSETSLDNYPFKYVIVNNWTLDELIQKVKNILQIEKIIK